MEDIRKPLIVICGPTATGKSRIAVEICKRICGEVVSADSMQLYKRMDIGTAKTTAEEMQGIPHHLIDVLEPWEHATASRYGAMAKEVIADIRARGKIPVLCGGTGLYIDAVTRPVCFSAPRNEDIQSELSDIENQTDGRLKLHSMLALVDREAAEKLHPNDVRRVKRAIESYRLTGKTMAQLAEEDKARQGDYRECLLAPEWSRARLYTRINQRVDDMMHAGLWDEARRLYESGTLGETAMQAIGYKELFEAMRGLCSKDEAVEKIKQFSRNYAKRQETWFRRDGRVKYFPAHDMDAAQIAQKMIDYIAMKGLLE